MDNYSVEKIIVEIRYWKSSLPVTVIFMNKNWNQSYLIYLKKFRKNHYPTPIIHI